MNLLDCTRCGKCKEVCPSYLVFLSESYAPRGRLYLSESLKKKILTDSRTIRERLLSCLLCGACVAKCPSGIDVPSAVCEVRERLKKTLKIKLAKYFSLYPGFFFSLLAKISKAPIVKSIFKTKAFEPIQRFTQFELKESNLGGLKIFSKLKSSGRVALFLGCTTYYLMPEIAHAYANILSRLNYEVLIPPQRCCGAPLLASGYRKEATEIARKNIEIYSSFKLDGVVSPCPTCFHYLDRVYRDLAGDSIRMIKFEEFLSAYPSQASEPKSRGRVVFHLSCHSLNYLNESEALLKNLERISKLEIERGDGCCGFAGLFSFLFQRQSMDITRKKVLEYDEANMIITSCPNCLIQFRFAMKDKEVLHYSEFINKISEGEKNATEGIKV